MLILPAPLRRQAEIVDGWLSTRLETILPSLMDRAGLSMWIVAAREYNEDPVSLSLLPATWLSVRRRTILIFARTESGVDRLTVSRYPIAEYDAVWDPAVEDQWSAVRRVVEERDPATIGIDMSTTFALADGLSATERAQLADALGPYAERLVGAETLAIGWLETRLPAEISAAQDLNRLVHDVIAESYTSAVITPGRTTALDVAWWLRQRLHDLGVDPWFQPTVDVQRPGAEAGDLPDDTVIEPGDLLHNDVGLVSFGLHTDTQQLAYVPRAGELAPPAGLVEALAIGNRMQDLTTAAFVRGRTGNEILAAALSAAAAEGIDGTVYSHPVGRHGHAAGPTIGMWDQQDGVPGTGDYPLHDDTIYALELSVRAPVAEWNDQQALIALEQGIAYTGGAVEYLDKRQTELTLVT